MEHFDCPSILRQSVLSICPMPFRHLGTPYLDRSSLDVCHIHLQVRCKILYFAIDMCINMVIFFSRLSKEKIKAVRV